VLTGLVLCGGNSSRMGTDKSKLKLHGKSLDEIAQANLQPFCDKVVFSINAAQNNLIYQLSVLDLYENEGPLSGILSAFYYLDSALLVLAVDMPLVNKKTIQALLGQRNSSKHVTAYYDENKHLWHGTLSIWEESSYPLLQSYFDNGGRSMQKFLHQINAQKVTFENPLELLNVNTLEEFNGIAER
jgi:molybdopterin-guanine dinucleotide biosynthesis protein A